MIVLEQKNKTKQKHALTVEKFRFLSGMQMCT